MFRKTLSISNFYMCDGTMKTEVNFVPLSYNLHSLCHFKPHVVTYTWQYLCGETPTWRVLLWATGPVSMPAPMLCALAGCGKRLSGPLDSASALWQRSRLQLTSGDFHCQGNPAKATPVS
jgi:hypothetical protein